MAVFERATKSVVFIANTAIQRDIWSFDTMEVPQGSGSGFVWSKQGYIVTNFHVIYGADTIKVTLADRSEHQAKIVGADPDHDLAVLQIKVSENLMEPLAVGASHDLRVGQKVSHRQSVRVGPSWPRESALRTHHQSMNRTIEGVCKPAAITPATPVARC
jgi:S1-C subfamily serine protease